MTEQYEVTGAVHWFECPLSLLDIEFEHVILVVSPVAGRLPDTHVIHIWSLNLLISPLPIFRPQELLKCIEDLGTIWQKKWTPRRNFIKEKELLVFPNPKMISLFCLFQELQMLLHKLFVWKSHPADSLQRVVTLVAKEIC